MKFVLDHCVPRPLLRHLRFRCSSLRNPTKSNSNSEPKRTLVPSETEQLFRAKANTDSDSFRTVIPMKSNTAFALFTPCL